MSARFSTLLAEALNLPEEDRGQLAFALLDSLDGARPNIDAMTEDEFKAELDRRHDEFLRDPSVGVPWEEVKRMTKVD
jgi:putative addiction module component (TIGR02574 family)